MSSNYMSYLLIQTCEYCERTAIGNAVKEIVASFLILGQASSALVLIAPD